MYPPIEARYRAHRFCYCAEAVPLVQLLQADRFIDWMLREEILIQTRKTLDVERTGW